MAVETREHVTGLAAVLSALSLGLVFAAAGGLIPAGALPRASDAVIHAIPHVNAGLSVAAIALIAGGVRAIRRGRVDRHRAAMVSAAALFALFLALYLYKVILEGPAPFPGPDPIYQFVYLPMLAVHITLAVVCVPLLYYVLLIGVTHPLQEIPETRHPRVGRIAAALWLVSFVLGIAVYLLLYHLF